MPERKKISDTCLLNRLVDGEMTAYEELFVRYYPTRCAYARMYVKREETAETVSYTHLVATASALVLYSVEG